MPEDNTFDNFIAEKAAQLTQYITATASKIASEHLEGDARNALLRQMVLEPFGQAVTDGLKMNLREDQKSSTFIAGSLLRSIKEQLLPLKGNHLTDDALASNAPYSSNDNTDSTLITTATTEKEQIMWTIGILAHRFQ